MNALTVFLPHSCTPEYNFDLGKVALSLGSTHKAIVIFGLALLVLFISLIPSR